MAVTGVAEHELYGKCPYVTVQKVLTGKWTLLIMHHLENGPLRFKELERVLAPITQATLTKQLRTMERNGLIHRKVYNQIPPKVEYSLTEVGESLKPVLANICIWSRLKRGDSDCPSLCTKCFYERK